MMLAQPQTLQPPPEYSFNAHISSPTAVQLRPKPARTHTPTFSIRPATLADAPAIAELGATVFSTTFGFSIPTADLTAYLEEAYSVSAIERDIQSPSTQVVVACSEVDGRVAGFSQLTEGTREPCISHLDSTIELQRLYVAADFHGVGVGKSLMKQLESTARDMGYQTMWLGVWEGNFMAQQVYERMGFSRVGEHEFQMGRCIQTDWIMCKDLS